MFVLPFQGVLLFLPAASNTFSEYMKIWCNILFIIDQLIFQNEDNYSTYSASCSGKLPGQKVNIIAVSSIKFLLKILQNHFKNLQIKLLKEPCKKYTNLTSERLPQVNQNPFLIEIQTI